MLVKVQAIILIAGFIFFSCVSEKPFTEITTKENDLPKLKLKGNVQTLIENTYKLDEVSGEIAKGELLYRDVFSFNEKGFYTEKTRYIQMDEINLRDVYFYDESDNLIEEKRYYGDDELKNRINYFYNDQKKLVELNHFNGEDNLTSKTIYSYDANGNLIEQVQSSADGALMEKRVFVYDESGQKIEFHHWPVGEIPGPMRTQNLYDEKGKVIQDKRFDVDGNLMQKRFYAYTDKGEKVEETRFDADDKLITTIKYAYDDEGNTISYLLLDPEGNISLEQSYMFENFDEKGNWLKKVYKTSTNASLIFEREIVYY